MKRPAEIDAAIVRRARGGDMGAHAELYRLMAPRVFTLAHRMLGGRRAVAEDVLQETFVEVIRGIAAYRGEGRIDAWIKRIAVTKCLMHLRSSWQSRRVDGADIDTLRAEPCADLSHERACLERALAALPDAARAVVWLHDVEGYTHEEIGRIMQRTASFSKSQLARAHERLRVSLHELDERNDRRCATALKTC